MKINHLSFVASSWFENTCCCCSVGMCSVTCIYLCSILLLITSVRVVIIFTVRRQNHHCVVCRLFWSVQWWRCIARFDRRFGKFFGDKFYGGLRWKIRNVCCIKDRKFTLNSPKSSSITSTFMKLFLGDSRSWYVLFERVDHEPSGCSWISLSSGPNFDDAMTSWKYPSITKFSYKAALSQTGQFHVGFRSFICT